LKDILEKPTLDKDMKIIEPFVLHQQAFENTLKKVFLNEHLINGGDKMWQQIYGFFN
jgi:hypothetical protein